MLAVGNVGERAGRGHPELDVASVVHLAFGVAVHEPDLGVVEPGRLEVGDGLFGPGLGFEHAGDGVVLLAGGHG